MKLDILKEMKLLVILIIAGFIFNCGSDTPAGGGGGSPGGSCGFNANIGMFDCLPDAYETNDTTLSASAISLGTTYSATISSGGFDIDFYTFTPGSLDDTCTISVNNVSADMNARISSQWINNNGVGMGEEVTISVIGGTPITTSVDSSNWVAGTYNLLVTCSATLPDTYEGASGSDNNFVTTATSGLSFATTYNASIHNGGTDVDFYTFTAGINDTMCRIDVNNVSTTFNTVITFYPVAGSLLNPVTYNAVGAGQREIYDATVVGNQSFAFKISDSTSTHVSPYDLRVECVALPQYLSGVCGDGTVNTGEQCDDGNITSGDGCNNSCQFEPIAAYSCGNGIIEPGETCDDNNTTSGDGCSNLCATEGLSGSAYNAGSGATTGGVYELTFNIPAGTTEVRIDSLWLAGDFSTPSIEFATVSAGSCSLGMATSPSGVDNGILYESVNFRDMVIPAQCWSAGSPLVLRFDASIDVNIIPSFYMYRYDATLAYFNFTCGNLALEFGEECDDGNVLPNDGCSANCKITPICGDGIVSLPESCDDGNLISGDGCSSICQLEACGNGIVDVNEQCDDGNTFGNDGCSGLCLTESIQYLSIIENVIVNGSVNTGFDKNYYTFNTVAGTKYQVWWNDLGNGDGTQTADIQVTITNDVTATNLITNMNSGFATPYEFVAANTGTATILVQSRFNSDLNVGTYQVRVRVPFCGDGIVDATENCDDGANIAGDGCSATCTFEASTTPTLLTLGQWANGNMPLTTNIAYYSFPATAGTVYYVRWNDWNGDGAKTGNISVNVTGVTSGTNYINNIGGWTAVNFTSLITENLLFTVTNAGTTGTFAVLIKVQVCGDNYIDPNEACDDGNIIAGDGCNSTCQVEAKPVTAGVWYNGNITDQIPSEILTISVIAGENYRIWWNDWGQGDGTQTANVFVTATNSVTGVNYFTSTSNGYTTPMKVTMTSTGLLTFTVTPSGTSRGTYQLLVDPVTCGDGILDTFAGEQCDDTNVIAGDGCSTTCQFEPFAATLGTLYSDTILNSVPGRIYSYAVTAANQYRVLWNDSMNGDGTQTLDVKVTATDMVSGINYFTAINSGWTTPQYFTATNTGNLEVLVVPQFAGNIGVYQVEVAVPICGDGFRDQTLLEQCDDGNLVSGDGCSVTCQIEFTQLVNFEAGIPATFIPDSLGFNWVADSTVLPSVAGSLTSAASGTITHSQISCVSMNITGGNGFSFDYKTDTESCCDKLKVYVNNTLQTTTYQGLTPWTTSTIISLPAAGNPLVTDTVKWCYSKDGSVSVGLDKVWIDNINY